MKNKLFALVLAAVMLMSVACGASAMTAGTYTQTVNAMHGPLTVEVTVTEDAIENVVVTDHVETPGVGDVAVEEIPAKIVANQTIDVDVVSGVTVTSRMIMYAAKGALEQAGADMAKFNVPAPKTVQGDVELSADVIIVGGGGAGLAAAVAATDEGASVIVIEKSGFLGGNSIVAGGIYNCPDPELQDYATFSGDQDSLIEAALAEAPVSEEHAALQAAVKAEFEAYKATDKTLFDSANWFALQTWNGGDKLGNLSMLKVFAENAYPSLQWLKSNGLEFADTVIVGAGSLYPRTHSALSPNGVGYIDAFTSVLSEREGVTIMMDTDGKSLIMDGDKVVGVNAVGKDGNTVTLKANKGVILATGGFAGNVELRQKYCEGEKWPDLSAKVNNSNMPAVTGDGIFMAEAAGAELVNMDQIQLLPFCDPQTGATYNIAGVDCFINKEGNRFVREDGRRDEMSKGIIAQTDSMMFVVNSTDDPSTRYSLGKKSVQYYVDNNLYGYMLAENLDDLASQMGVPADALKATIADFNAHVESGEVDFTGRVSYTSKIEGKYYYAYPRKPAVHHTMGGVNVDTQTHALRADGSIIEGLYCAGEIVGNLHGGNRLGGNAIVDFCVFGRIAGTNAAKGN